MSSNASGVKNEPEVMVIDDSGDESSPDSTPLATQTQTQRTLTTATSNDDKPVEKDIEAPPKPEENKSESNEEKEKKETKNASQPEPPPSRSTMLAKQIQELVTLRRSVAAMRDVPGRLLTFQSPVLAASFDPMRQEDGIQGAGLMLDDALSSGAGASQPAGDETIDSIISSAVNSTKPQNPLTLVNAAFEAMEGAKKLLLSDLVQQAMRDAELESIAESDKQDLNLGGRKDRKKKKRIFADSPAPFPSLQLQHTVVFPADPENHRSPFTYNDLLPYLRQKNRGTDRDGFGIKLHIWAKSKTSPCIPHVSEPLIIRAKFEDVVTMFLKVTFRSVQDPIAIESVVAFGPREKKGPYSHSEYTVFELLTQSLMRMIEAEPTVTFPQMINLLSTYETLFDARCSVCGNILSPEGHVPPVTRIWTDNPGGRGLWVPRHVSCLHD